MQKTCIQVLEAMETTPDKENTLVRQFDSNKLTSYYPNDNMIQLLFGTRSDDADRLKRGLSIIIETLQVSMIKVMKKQ